MWAFGGMLIGELTGLRFRGMTHFISNAHYYGDPNIADEDRHKKDQTRGVRIMLEREPMRFPTVQLSPIMGEVARLIYEGVIDPLSRDDVNPDKLSYPNFLAQHVILTDYHPHPFINRELLPVSV